jgi:hypothetical protein
MPRLDTPDLCAHLDRLKALCDRLEKAQNDDRRYRDLMRRIRAETDALHATICRFQPASRMRIVGVGS